MWAAIRPWLFPVWCIGCGEHGVGLCVACAATARPVAVLLEGLAVGAASDYDGAVREAILGMKRGERAYLDPLAALLAPLVERGSIIVPVATTRQRAAARGFDQGRELARRVAEIRSATYDDVLVKRGAAQRGLGRGERLKAQGRFAVRRGALVPSSAVLLDDVLTTGATLLDAAAALAAAGCSVDGAVVVARTPPGRETPRGGRRLVGA
jgi:predicted amidophosphoribosyltransferase